MGTSIGSHTSCGTGPGEPPTPTRPDAASPGAGLGSAVGGADGARRVRPINPRVGPRGASGCETPRAGTFRGTVVRRPSTVYCLEGRRGRGRGAQSRRVGTARGRLLRFDVGCAAGGPRTRPRRRRGHARSLPPARQGGRDEAPWGPQGRPSLPLDNF